VVATAIYQNILFNHHPNFDSHSRKAAPPDNFTEPDSRIWFRSPRDQSDTIIPHSGQNCQGIPANACRPAYPGATIKTDIIAPFAKKTD
jgi:hypothetical protein